MELNGKRTFYHGTGVKFDQIDLKCCRDRRDFGRGFYLTSQPVQARKWAESKGRRAGVCWVYQYCLDNTTDNVPLRELPLLEYDRRWLDIITYCRQTGSVPRHIQQERGVEDPSEYDVVYDRMADNTWDRLADLIQQYYENRTTAAAVLRYLPFPSNVAAFRDQYCFKTERALCLLRRCRACMYRWSSGGGWELEWEEEEL